MSNSTRCINNQESQLNRVFDWISDSAPNHRNKCTASQQGAQVKPCKASGPSQNLIDKESQLKGIEQHKHTMEDILPDEPDHDYTEQPIANFMDVNHTRTKRSEGQSYMLDRFHPLATGNPQIHILDKNFSEANERAGSWSRNESRENFKCPMYSK